jgi:hypothetical protein
MTILKKFAKQCLEDITYPKTPKTWHVQGRLKNKSNQIFKFDVRGMSKAEGKKLEKTGDTKSNADKMVFETDTHWIILDTNEIHEYIEKYNIRDILLDDLLAKSEWNIIISKTG